MKLVSKHIEKDGSVSEQPRFRPLLGCHCLPYELPSRRAETDQRQGYVVLLPEDEEDMWHVYNLISEGDEVQAKTDRKVHSQSSTGSTTTYRVQLNLTIVVKRVSCHVAAAQRFKWSHSWRKSLSLHGAACCCH